MLRNMLRRSAGGRLIAGTPQIGIIASQILAETATGDNGAGLLYDEASAHSGRQLRIKVTSWNGTPSTLFVYENGSFLVEGQADGAYAIGYDWEAWGAGGSLVTGSDTAPVQVGPLNATATGATIIGSGSIIGGAASGEQNNVAPGATLAGSGSIIGGTTSGEQNGVAPGATLTGGATLLPGVADGQGNATAPGATLSGTAAIVPGAATGEQSAIAPGADLSGAGTIIGGAAIGEGSGDATGPGATLDGAGQFVPGLADGQINASAPGADLSGNGTMQPGAAIGDHDATAPGATLSGDGQLLPGGANDGTSVACFALAVSIEKRTRLGLSAGRVTAYLWQEIILENVYLKGEVARLHCRVADSSGQDIDPPALSLMTRYGNGVASERVYGIAPEVVRAGQGRYYADIPLTERGTMYYRWETGALDTGAGESSIVVRGGRFQ